MCSVLICPCSRPARSLMQDSLLGIKIGAKPVTKSVKGVKGGRGQSCLIFYLGWNMFGS